MERPRKVERCNPLMKPCTTILATSDRFWIRASAAGSMNRVWGAGMGTSGSGPMRYIREAGTGTSAISRRTMASESTFSDWAWKLGSTRCRKMGGASACTSSIAT